MEWADGYVTEIDYIHAYHRELNPAMLRLACMAAGVQPPCAADPTYLELGFGQGVSVNVHAAAHAGSYWGVDVNPAHAARAAALADASGAALFLFDDAFAEFATRDDLPVFDFIVLHGVWSWVSDQSRAAILRIVRDKLRVGGVVYLSYNCQPGWAASVPVRHLMTEYMRHGGAGHGRTLAGVDDALAFVNKIAAAGSAYFDSHPSLPSYLKSLSDHDRSYLAHEYLNRDWHVTYFADVATAMAGAKTTFAASARLLDHIDEYSLDASSRRTLAEIAHPTLQQTIRDYLVNQKFRMDIFVKGQRALLGIEAHALWLRERFTLTVPSEITKLKHVTPMGDLELDERIYGPLIEGLASDRYAAKTIPQLRELPRLSVFDTGSLLSALLMLVGLGYVQPAKVASADERQRCDALNRHLCQRALATSEISVLASPVLGGGRHVPQEQQLILLARLAGMTTPLEQAIYLNSTYETNGGNLRRHGKPVQMGDEAIAQFKALAEAFVSDGHAAILDALQVLAPDRGR